MSDLIKRPSPEQLRPFLQAVITESSCADLPVIRGKVRDIYDLGETLGLVATDRLSAFDRAITTIPFKGAVLNRLSGWWFSRVGAIVKHHLLALPHPNLAVVEKCRPLPVEFVVRGYLTGSTSTSIWRHYREGAREYCGHRLPGGMQKNQPLPQAILTPTTKSAEHDEPLSAAEVLQRGMVPAAVWEQASAAALELFALGQKVAAQAGFILADTKYEFGLSEAGDLRLIDEVHTPDSSRFWLAATYPERTGTGLEPQSADKEKIRLWYAERGDPYRTGDLPPTPDDLRLEVSADYIELYQRLTGEQFPIEPYDGESLAAALRRAAV